MIFRIKPGHYIPHVVYYWHMDLLFTVNHYAYKNTHNNTPEMFTRVLLQEIFQIWYYILIW